MTVTLKVYLLDSTLAFDRLYTYLADEETSGKGRTIRRGMFVVVPFGFGNTRREAVVWEVERGGNAFTGCPDPSVNGARGALPEAVGGIPENGGKKQIVLKHIFETYDDEPLSDEEFELCAGLCRLYACTPGTAIRCIRPFRSQKKPRAETVETVTLSISKEEARRLTSETAIKNIFQLKMLEELSSENSSGTVDTDVLLLRTGAKRPQLKALEKKGCVRLGSREAGGEDIAAGLNGSSAGGLSTYSEHELNEGQREAYEAVRASVDSSKPEVFLLHGITGSGKTEVYMHLISHVLAQGGDVIMMVPEIALTPQMISHFTSRFGENVALWHSALTDAMRRREWYRMKKGLARIAVCTRSGIFVPLKNVKLVIVDEAHDGSYRSEETGLRYNTCEVAELRFGEKASVIYGSATPDVTMYYRAQKGEIRLLELRERAGAGTLPDMHVVDMREERAALANGSLFSSELKKALSDNYSKGGQAMLFVGRRGYSSRLFCRECGRTMICGACGLPMTFHRSVKRLLCSYCGKAAPAPEKCPACGSATLGFGSAGTERVEAEIRQLFPDAAVLRMDSDTVKGRDGHGAILKKFQKEKVPFLVGTQMITKGHDFPGVTLVGIIDADGQINQPEYYAGEKAYQIIAQVAGRAGRGSERGQVIIQTYSVDDMSIRAAVNGNYKEFYEKELSFRRTMLYPPFCSLCSIRVSGTDDRGTYDYLSALASAMRAEAGDDTFILGPSRESIPKIGDRYRWQLTIKSRGRDQIIALFLRQYDKIKVPPGARLATVFEN